MITIAHGEGVQRFGRWASRVRHSDHRLGVQRSAQYSVYLGELDAKSHDLYLIINASVENQTVVGRPLDEIAGAIPAVAAVGQGHETRGGSFWVFPVARGHLWPCKTQFAALALAHGVPRGINDCNLMAGEWPADRHRSFGT